MQQLNREARRITAELNGSYHEMDEIQALFSELTGRPVDKTFGLFPPFYTDCGKIYGLAKVCLSMPDVISRIRAASQWEITL